MVIGSDPAHPLLHRCFAFFKSDLLWKLLFMLRRPFEWLAVEPPRNRNTFLIFRKHFANLVVAFLRHFKEIERIPLWEQRLANAAWLYSLRIYIKQIQMTCIIFIPVRWNQVQDEGYASAFKFVVVAEQSICGIVNCCRNSHILCQSKQLYSSDGLQRRPEFV